MPGWPSLVAGACNAQSTFGNHVHNKFAVNKAMVDVLVPMIMTTNVKPTRIDLSIKPVEVLMRKQKCRCLGHIDC